MWWKSRLTADLKCFLSEVPVHSKVAPRLIPRKTYSQAPHTSMWRNWLWEASGPTPPPPLFPWEVEPVIWLVGLGSSAPSSKEISSPPQRCFFAPPHYWFYMDRSPQVRRDSSPLPVTGCVRLFRKAQHWEDCLAAYLSPKNPHISVAKKLSSLISIHWNPSIISQWVLIWVRKRRCSLWTP